MTPSLTGGHCSGSGDAAKCTVRLPCGGSSTTRSEDRGAGRLRLRRLRRRQPPLRGGGRAHPPPPRRPSQPLPLRRDPGPQEARRARPPHRVHPQPHVRGRRPPGRAHGLLRRRQPRREDAARAHGRADAEHPGVPQPGAPARAARRAGRPCLPDVPDARQPRRGAVARRPRPDPGRDPRVQRVAPRRMALRLRGPHLLDTAREPLHRRGGHRRARPGPRARRPCGPAAPRAGERPPRDPLTLPPRVRPVLGARRRRRASSSSCTRPTAGTSST